MVNTLTFPISSVTIERAPFFPVKTFINVPKFYYTQLYYTALYYMYMYTVLYCPLSGRMKIGVRAKRLINLGALG